MKTMTELVAPIISMKFGQDEKKVEEELKSKKENTIYTSFFENDGILHEQINDYGKPSFAVYGGGKVEYKSLVNIAGVVYSPLIAEEVSKGVILLAQRAEEYGSEEQLVSEIETFLKKWVGVSKGYYRIATYYIITSWVYDRFDTINYLRALGDTGTGKSRFLDTIGGLCYKATQAAGAITPAAVFRLIEKWGGTLILDEADFKDSDETNEIIKLLNVGFEKHKSVIRCDKNDPNKLQFFRVFCPKIIATRKTFGDVATEARCLTEATFQDGSKPDTKDHSFYEERQTLINKLLMFRFKNYFKVDVQNVLSIDLSSLEPRLRQASRSFLALVWDNPQVLEEFKKFLEVYNREIIEVRSGSYDGQIINHLAELITGTEGDLKITCEDVANALGEKFTNRSVGKHLRLLNIGLSTPTKINGVNKKTIVFDKMKFGIIFSRYISDDELLAKLNEKDYRTTETTEHTETSLVEKNNNNNLKAFQSGGVVSPSSVGSLGSSVVKLQTRDNWFKAKKPFFGKCLDCCHDNKQLPYCEVGQEFGCYCEGCFKSFGVSLQ